MSFGREEFHALLPVSRVVRFLQVIFLHTLPLFESIRPYPNQRTQHHATVNADKYFFFNHVYDVWSSLPSIVEASFSDIFGRLLIDDIDFSKFMIVLY